MVGNDKHCVGVDWSSGKWLAVAYSDQEPPSVGVFGTIRDLWDTYSETVERLVIDIPIGLCGSLDDAGEGGCYLEDGELSRRCDDLARSVIGPRYPSVFTPPARDAAKLALRNGLHDDINKLNEELTGKGLTKQAANIAVGIVEVEELLLDGVDHEVVVEGHPEVCFRAFKSEHLQHSKKTAAGVDERLCALESVADYREGSWRELAHDLRTERRDVGFDDLFDAIALALTARAPDSEFKKLPPEPPVDSKNLPMQMVYRAESAMIE